MNGRSHLAQLLASIGAAGVLVGGALVFAAAALQPLDSGVLLRAGALAEAEDRGATPFSPLAVGDTLTFEFVGSDERTQRFELSVVDGLSDATASLPEIDSNNGLPPFGHLYGLARVEIGYLGGPQPGDLGDLQFVIVPEGADANRPGDALARTTYASYCGVLADPLDLEAAVYAGTVLQGELCWTIRTSELGGLLLRVEAPDGQRRWLALG